MTVHTELCTKVILLLLKDQSEAACCFDDACLQVSSWQAAFAWIFSCKSITALQVQVQVPKLYRCLIVIRKGGGRRVVRLLATDDQCCGCYSIKTTYYSLLATVKKMNSLMFSLWKVSPYITSLEQNLT